MYDQERTKRAFNYEGGSKPAEPYSAHQYGGGNVYGGSGYGAGGSGYDNYSGGAGGSRAADKPKDGDVNLSLAELEEQKKMFEYYEK